MTWAVFIRGSVWILVKSGKDLHSLQESLVTFPTYISETDKATSRWSNDKSAGPHTPLLIQQLKDKWAAILSAQLYKWWSAGKQPTQPFSKGITGTVQKHDVQSAGQLAFLHLALGLQAQHLPCWTFRSFYLFTVIIHPVGFSYQESKIRV